MPTFSKSTLAQITNSGRDVQQKNQRITVLECGLGESGRPSVQSAYVHMPFCFHKCHYCDFYSIVDTRDRQAEYVDRLIAEIEAVTRFLNPPLKTVFVGGGTPTLLPPALWRKLLAAMNRHMPVAEHGEFTVECNPETLTDELAAVLREGGVNRLSIGCQSFNPAHLKTLERWHDPANVHRSVAISRAAGIDNINLDLIFAIPGQSLAEWVADVDEALSLAPSHLSCYGLVFEPNTPLTVKMRAGRISPCEQDLEAQMYQAAIDRLSAAGFHHYEISNWARLGKQCQHNMVYWQNENWWPLGTSASGHVDGLRWKNIARLGEYLEAGPFPAVCDVERLDDDGRIGEQFMLGLRLVQGIDTGQLDALLARGQRAEARRAAIDRHLKAGLLEIACGRLRLHSRGLMLADAVLADLI